MILWMRVVIALALTGVFVEIILGSWAESAVPTASCLDVETREKVRSIMLDGIDQGLKQHTVTIFDSWLKDPAEQPARAIRGMQSGISAYARSRREALRWTIPTC